jgi:hypothetical protein
LPTPHSRERAGEGIVRLSAGSFSERNGFPPPRRFRGNDEKARRIKQVPVIPRKRESIAPLARSVAMESKKLVMAGLVPAIHVFDFAAALSRGWPQQVSTSAAMTVQSKTIPH